MQRRNPRDRAPTLNFARRSRLRAATLVELAFTLLVLSILTGVGVTRLGRGTVLMSRCERAARRLMADLRAARSDAVAAALPHRLVLDGDGRTVSHYTVVRVEPRGPVPTGQRREVPDGVVLTATAAQVEFGPGGDARLPASFSIAAPARAYRVSVATATGAVCIEETTP